jgi:hypothetical protein
MKKVLVGLILGLALGAAATWFYLRHSADSAPAKGEAAAPAAPEKPKENPLHLPPAKRAAAGIILAKPTAATLTPTVQGFGRVLDASPLVMLVAELQTAKAADAASTKELERVKKLFATGNNASAQTLETAEAASARDRAAVASARVRLIASWGKKIAAETDLGALVDSLANGNAIARIDLLPGEMSATDLKTARVSLIGQDQSFDAELLGGAPVADPQVQGLSFLVLLRDHPLPVGAALRASLAGVGEPQSVLVIPRSAIVYHQGSPWIYVLGEEDTFERKIVSLGRTEGENVAVLTGIEPEEQIVTTGPEQLLAAELQSGGADAEP